MNCHLINLGICIYLHTARTVYHTYAAVTAADDLSTYPCWNTGTQGSDWLFLRTTEWIFFLCISDIAEKFNLDLSEGEINQVTTKYDLNKNGRFAYYNFLQSCILLLKPQERSLLQRVIIQKPQKPVGTKLIKIKMAIFFPFLLYWQDSSWPVSIVTLCRDFPAFSYLIPWY